MARSPQLSLSDLVEAHQESLVRFLTKRLGDPEDAAEVAQEAYLRLTKVENLRELVNPRAFLFRMAANLAVDRMRQRTRQARQVAPQGQPAASPEEELQAQERIDQATEVLRKLPEKCRRAFILHRVNGLSHAEIAEELAVSRKTVEKYMTLALRRLRRRLRPKKW